MLLADMLMKPFVPTGDEGDTEEPSGIDPYWDDVVLLLKGDGANGSTSIIDSSPLNNPITVLGDARISTTASKFGGSSLVFDGNGDFLDVPKDGVWFASFDFTVELWYQFTSLSGIHDFVSCWNSKSGDFAFLWMDGGFDYWYVTSGPDHVSAAFAPALGVWYHIALVKRGTSVRFFVDGEMKGSVATVPNIGVSSLANIRVAGLYAPARSCSGYVDELRITKGIARYLSNFPQPVEPFPTKGHTLPNTDEGDPYWTNVVLLMHMNDGTFVDETGKTTVNYGATLSSTDSKFGDGHAEFNGSGNWISVPSNSDLVLGASDYTVEFFQKMQGVTPTACWRGVLSIGNGHKTNGAVTIYIPASSANTISVISSKNYIMRDIATTLNDGQWRHIALTRKSDTLRLFVDGQLLSTKTQSNSIPHDTIAIGRDVNCGSTFYQGSIDELRITKGAARYVSSFTPPTAPFFNHAPPITPLQGSLTAIGGSITDIDGFRVHTFTESGEFIVTGGEGEIEYLIIGGGGGGGNTIAGGGGAGGYLSSVAGEFSGGGALAEPRIVLTPGTYLIQVGLGGDGAPATGNSGRGHSRGSNGQDSSAFGYVASGGGGGGAYDADGNVHFGMDGGAGGGAAATYSVRGGYGAHKQGNDGAAGDGSRTPSRGGGGGGAGSMGTLQNGGDGLASSITGSIVIRAGGGGGGARYGSQTAGVGAAGGGDGTDNNALAGHALANTGSGGGGGGWESGAGGPGGNGGSGIVVIRYAI